MARYSTQLLLACFLIAFAVFFGVDTATKGMERIHGPVTPASDTWKQQTETTVPLKTEATAKSTEPKQEITFKPEAKETVIQRIAETIGKLLQIIAEHSVKFVVSLFDKLIQ